MSIYLLHYAVIVKVKVLKKPCLPWENSDSFPVKIIVLEKLLGIGQVLKLNELKDMRRWSRIYLKLGLLMGTNRKPYLQKTFFF